MLRKGRVHAGNVEAPTSGAADHGRPSPVRGEKKSWFVPFVA